MMALQRQRLVERSLGLVGWLAVAAALAASPGVGATLPPARPLLATGDVIDGLGLIGTGILTAHGIDQRGRVLVAAALSSGVTGLYWADERGLEPVWVPALDDPRRVNQPRISASGRVMDTDEARLALYEISPSGPTALVHVGDVAADGATICAFGRYAVNDTGALAFGAAAVAAGASCDGGDWRNRIFILRDGTIRPIPSGVPDEAYADLVGIADDDSVAMNTEPSALVVVHADGRRLAIESGTPTGPDGAPLRDPYGLTLGPAGDLVFFARVDGLGGIYQSDADGIRPVLRMGDELPNGSAVAGIDAAEWVNGRGEVVVLARWSEIGADQRWHDVGGAVLCPVSGERRILGLDLTPAGINDADSVALAMYTGGPRIDRWHSGLLQTLVQPGDAAPGGELIAVGGINPDPCLGADGRVGAAVTNADYAPGLLCLDAAGAQKIARRGEAAPEGGVFEDFGQCVFADGDDVLFVASRRDPLGNSEASVYRGTAAGIERVIGPGQELSDGTRIHYIFGAIGTADQFVANQRGTVLASVAVDDGSLRFVRRRRGGPLETVSFKLEDDPLGRQVITIAWISLAADDSVVGEALIDRDGQHWALAVSDGHRARLLIDSDDPRLPGAPVDRFHGPLASGARVLTFAYGADGLYHALEMSLADGSVRDVLAPSPSTSEPWVVRDFTPAGRLLFDQFPPDGSPPQHWLLVDDRLIPMPDGTIAGGSAVVAVNDRDNLLVFEQPATGVGAQRLLLTGPPTTAACFVPPTGIPEPIATPTPSPTPIVCPESGDPRCQVLEVGTASGRPGERTTIDVRLRAGDRPIAGVQIDLHFVATAPFAADERRKPVCRVNPAINKPATAYNFLPDGCTPGGNCEILRALVLALDNVDPIPGGSLLFECDLTIAADAVSGRYAVPSSNVGFSDPDGYALPGSVEGGAVEVLAATDAPAGGGSTGAAGSDGCQVAAATSPGAWPFVALMLLVPLRARRRRAALRRNGAVRW